MALKLKMKLRKFCYVCVAHLPAKRDLKTKSLNKKYGHFIFISRLTGKCATQKFKKIMQFQSMDKFISYGHKKKKKLIF